MNSQISASKQARITVAAFALGLSLTTTVSNLRAQTAGQSTPPPQPQNSASSEQSAPTATAVSAEIASSVAKDLANGNESMASSDFAAAQMYYEQAFLTCESANVQGPLRARVYMSLGALFAGYLQDIAKGTDFMKKALQADKNSEPEKAIQNNLVMSTLNLVRESMGLGAPTDQKQPAGQPRELGDFWVMKHVRTENAKLLFPVGFFIEVNPLVAVKGVRYYFRFPTDHNYKVLEMERKDNLYGVMISCDAIAFLEPRSISYYIEVVGGNGEIIAREGSSAEPVVVAMIPEDKFQGTHPILPGMPQPEKCNPDQAAPCPPWDPHCKDVPCVTDEDCVRGKICIEEFCKSSGEAPPMEGGPVGIVIAGGVGLGAGVVMGDEEGIYDLTGPDARIQLEPGFSPSWMFTRLMAGYFLRDNVLLGAFVRFQHIRKDEYAVPRTNSSGTQLVDEDGNRIWDIEQVNYKMKIAGIMLNGQREGYEDNWKGPMWGPTLAIFLVGDGKWLGPGQVRDTYGELKKKQGFRLYSRFEVNIYGAMYHEVSLSPAEKPETNEDDPDTFYRQHVSGMEAVGAGLGALFGLSKNFDLGAEVMYDLMLPTVAHNFDFQLQMQVHF